MQTEATEFYAALMRRWKHQDTPEQLRVENSIDMDRKSSGGSIDLAEREVDQALSERVQRAPLLSLLLVIMCLIMTDAVFCYLFTSSDGRACCADCASRTGARSFRARRRSILSPTSSSSGRAASRRKFSKSSPVRAYSPRLARSLTRGSQVSAAWSAAAWC